MRDGVDERVVLFIAPDFAHQKNRVQHDAADDHRQQQEAQKQQNTGTPVEQHPADIQQQDDRNQADAERDKERDRFLAPGNYHDSSLS